MNQIRAVLFWGAFFLTNKILADGCPEDVAAVSPRASNVVYEMRQYNSGGMKIFERLQHRGFGFGQEHLKSTPHWANHVSHGYFFRSAARELMYSPWAKFLLDDNLKEQLRGVNFSRTLHIPKSGEETETFDFGPEFSTYAFFKAGMSLTTISQFIKGYDAKITGKIKKMKDGRIRVPIDAHGLALILMTDHPRFLGTGNIWGYQVINGVHQEVGTLVEEEALKKHLENIISKADRALHKAALDSAARTRKANSEAADIIMLERSTGDISRLVREGKRAIGARRSWWGGGGGMSKGHSKPWTWPAVTEQEALNEVSGEEAARIKASLYRAEQQANGVRGAADRENSALWYDWEHLHKRLREVARYNLPE